MRTDFPEDNSHDLKPHASSFHFIKATFVEHPVTDQMFADRASTSNAEILIRFANPLSVHIHQVYEIYTAISP
jgi:hypothetical protein